MSTPNQIPGQWIHVGGSGNNIAVGAGSRAGNVNVSGGDGPDIATLLEQIRSIAGAVPDRAAGEQAHAAVAAIESDLAKPSTHRFSINGAVAALSNLGAAVPGLTQLVEALSKALR